MQHLFRVANIVKKSPAVAKVSRPYFPARKCERSFVLKACNVNFQQRPKILVLQVSAKPVQLATWWATTDSL